MSNKFQLREAYRFRDPTTMEMQITRQACFRMWRLKYYYEEQIVSGSNVQSMSPCPVLIQGSQKVLEQQEHELPFHPKHQKEMLRTTQHFEEMGSGICHNSHRNTDTRLTS